jgi:hypothetical protein
MASGKTEIGRAGRGLDCDLPDAAGAEQHFEGRVLQ